MSEADRPNLAESLRGALATGPGGRPIRKRGYHRALKRGEVWAHHQKTMNAMMNSLSRMFFDQTVLSWKDNAKFYGLGSLVTRQGDSKNE